jgi:hypothetical protein
LNSKPWNAIGNICPQGHAGLKILMVTTVLGIGIRRVGWLLPPGPPRPLRGPPTSQNHDIENWWKNVGVMQFIFRWVLKNERRVAYHYLIYYIISIFYFVGNKGYWIKSINQIFKTCFKWKMLRFAWFGRVVRWVGAPKVVADHAPNTYGIRWFRKCIFEKLMCWYIIYSSHWLNALIVYMYLAHIWSSLTLLLK